jgi:tetratricopeptide (TPR) repeat protein
VLLAAPAAGGELPFVFQAYPLGGLPAQAATLLVQGGQGGELPIAALAVSGPRGVPLLVEVEGFGLLEGGAQGTLELEVHAYALAPTGAVQGFSSHLLRIPLEEYGEALAASGVKLLTRLELPPGEYSLRVLARERRSGRFGLRTQPLLVPAARASEPRVLGVLVPEPANRWLLARPAVPAAPEDPAAEPPATAEETWGPFLAAGGQGSPAGWPLLAAGGPVEVAVVASGLRPGSPLTARLEPEGDTAGAPPIVVPLALGPAIDLGPALALVPARLAIPPLPTGAYRLIVSTPEGASLGLPALVLEAGPGPGPRVWGEVRGGPGSLPDPGDRRAELPEDLPERRRPRNRLLEQAARQLTLEALERLSREAVGAVAASLGQAQERFLESAPAEAMAALDSVPDALAAELSAQDPEALVPFLMLQLELYRHHREEGRFGLATFARRSVGGLAGSYADQAGDDTARQLAGRALVILGGELVQARLWTEGGALLERALALDLDNETARLLLAAHYEKLARYGDAVTTLDALVARRPKSPEGRLRLALNLCRIGDRARCQELLTRLVSERNPPWTLAVAYGELARLARQGGRPGEALSWLLRAIDRLPEDAGLRLQLAFTLDGERRFRDARTLLEPLARGGADRGPSPRHRYASWPGDDRAELERELLAAVRARLPLLTRVLEARRPAPPEPRGRRP